MVVDRQSGKTRRTEIMSANFVEELVAEYYRLKGYMVMSNYWFPTQTQRNRTQRGTAQEYSARSWSDIDVLAAGKDELLIVQVKAIINQRSVAEKILKFFDQATTYLDEESAPDQSHSIAWWKDGRAIKKLVVYEYYSPPSYLDILREAGVEVCQFSSYFDEIVEYIKNKSGVKEESPLMRMVHFLEKNDYLVNKTQQTDMATEPVKGT
jgi:hypothetical protein